MKRNTGLKWIDKVSWSLPGMGYFKRNSNSFDWDKFFFKYLLQSFDVYLRLFTYSKNYGKLYF